MKVTTETLPERQLKLQIEIDDDRHAAAMEQAYRRLAPRVRIRGFRPGKAPRALIEKEIGHHRLLDEAMDIVVPEAYREALEQESIVPVASPEVELVSHEPLVFTATVPLEPVVDLGDYQSIRIPRAPITVTDEEVEESLTELRRRQGTLEPVDRAAASGDVIRGNVKATSGDRTLFEQDEIEFRLSEDTLASLPGLADMLIGMKKGETKESSAVIPDDYQDESIRGETVNYTVTVHDVKEEKLAEANDEFAKEVNEEFETLDALRQRIREDLQRSAEETARPAYETACLDALVEKATVEFPAVMIEHEVDHILEEQANLDPGDPRALEIYMQRMNKSEAEARESVRPDAERRLLRSLVLSKFADTEGITIGPEDVDAEIETMVGQAGEQADLIRRIFGSDQGRENLARTLLTRKTFARLTGMANGESESPAAEATEATETTDEATEEKKPARRPARSRRSAPKTSE